MMAACDKRHLERKSASGQDEDPMERYPDCGPLSIKTHQQFLTFSKTFFNAHFGKTCKSREKLKDFDIIKKLGRGTFGSVMLAKHSHSKRDYAIKIISKVKLVRTKQVNQTLQEKRVLQALNCPFTIYLVYFFMDNSYLYLVLPYIMGGELHEYLVRFGKFDEPQAQFYLSQIVLGLEYLHHLGLIHRDLKTENILLDQTGYIKLVDFGFCKKLEKDRTYTLCGTPEYMAPEIILNLGHGPPADWWATGVLAFELVSGRTPFYHMEKMRIYEKIVTNSYHMNYTFSDDLKDLINNLLQKDLSKRYGNMKGGVEDIKRHKWFKTVNWMAVLNRKITPEFIPKYLDKPASEKLKESLLLKVDEEDTNAELFRIFNDH